MRRGGTLHHVVAHERPLRAWRRFCTPRRRRRCDDLREVRTQSVMLVPAAGRASRGKSTPPRGPRIQLRRVGSGNGEEEKVRSRDRTNARKQRGRHRRVVGERGRAGSKPKQTYPWEQTAAVTPSASAGWTSREDDASSRARQSRPRAPSRIFEARSKPGRFCVDDPSGRSPAEPRPAGACSDRFALRTRPSRCPASRCYQKGGARSMRRRPSSDNHDFSTTRTLAPCKCAAFAPRAQRRRDAGFY